MDYEFKRRKPNEFWTEYFVRTLANKGYDISDEFEVDIASQDDDTFITLSNEIKTNRGQIRLMKQLEFNRNVLKPNKKRLEKLAMTNFIDYFSIEEQDIDKEHPYRSFAFMIENGNTVIDVEHSSLYQVPNYPSRNSWINMPLIEKYANKKRKWKPKRLVDDTMRYLDTVGIYAPSQKKESQEIIKGPGLSLDLLRY